MTVVVDAARRRVGRPGECRTEESMAKVQCPNCGGHHAERWRLPLWMALVGAIIAPPAIDWVLAVPTWFYQRVFHPRKFKHGWRCTKCGYEWIEWEGPFM